MKKQQASKYFHGEEGFNCVQAVLKTFQPESGMSDFTIKSAQIAGGGRAKGGVCGALYAAQIILGEGTEQDKVNRSFIEATGSPLCDDIKVSECRCREFVEIATELTNEHLEEVSADNPDYVFERKIREAKMLLPPEETT